MPMFTRLFCTRTVACYFSVCYKYLYVWRTYLKIFPYTLYFLLCEVQYAYNCPPLSLPSTSSRPNQRGALALGLADGDELPYYFDRVRICIMVHTNARGGWTWISAVDGHHATHLIRNMLSVQALIVLTSSVRSSV